MQSTERDALQKPLSLQEWVQLPFPEVKNGFQSRILERRTLRVRKTRVAEVGAMSEVERARSKSHSPPTLEHNQGH